MRARRLIGLGVALSCLGAAAAAADACAPLAPPEGIVAKDGGGGGVPVEAPSGLQIVGLTVTSAPGCPLAMTVAFQTTAAALATVQISNLSPGGSTNQVTPPPESAASTTHAIPLLGLRAASTFQLTLTATDATGATVTLGTTFPTPPLPANMAPITVAASDPASSSPGFTLLTLWRWDGSPSAYIDPTAAYVVAVDASGQVVWYYQGINVPGGFVSDAIRLPNGHIAFITANVGWTEIDMMGRTIQTHAAASLGLDSMHDDLFAEADGSLLGLTTQLRSVSGFPSLDGGAVEGGLTYPVVGDGIVELAGDGGLLHQWSTFDVLDPRHQGNQLIFQSNYWNFIYPDAGDTKDWTHGDSVVRDPTDGTLVFSSLTQSWIVKFGLDDAGVPARKWRLGAGGDFALVGDTFQFNQNTASVLPNGHVMCFDNGNFRLLPDGGATTLYSRAVEFALDTKAGTATVAWQYAETPSFFSPLLGSAYALDNGNVLIAVGGILANPTGSVLDPTNLKSARVLEVTHDAAPRKVFEIDVGAALGSVPGDPAFSGYSVNRAHRIPSLY